MKNLLNRIGKAWQSPNTVRLTNSATLGFCYDHVSESPGRRAAKDPAKLTWSKQSSPVLNKF